MANQTVYNADHKTAIAGMVADTSLATIVSRTVQGDDVAFGTAVKLGTADRTVTNVETDDTAIYGFAVRSQALEAEANAYSAGDTAAIMLQGPIWVEVGANVADGNPVFVTVATGAITGASGAGKVAVSGASFETTATSGNLALVRII